MGLKKTEYANLAVGRLNASIWCDSANMNYLAFLFFFFFPGLEFKYCERYPYMFCFPF